MVIHRAASLLLLLCGIAACATTTSDNRRPADAPEPLADGGQMAPPVAVVETPVAAMPAAEPAPALPAPAPPVPMAKPKPAKPRLAVAKTPVVPLPAPAKSVAANVAGRLELVAGGRERIVAGEVAEGLVYFLPKSGGAAPKPGSYTVDTRSKGFSPSVLVVPVGSTVRFPNRDSILHNVFSRTPGSAFDFGYYGPGESRQRVFSRPGLVIVNCNVHHNMRADIVVLATPYYTRPDRNGRYSLSGLPKGPGTLVFWHPRADARQVAVTLPTSAAVTQTLAATKPSRHAGMQGH